MFGVYSKSTEAVEIQQIIITIQQKYYRMNDERCYEWYGEEKVAVFVAHLANIFVCEFKNFTRTKKPTFLDKN